MELVRASFEILEPHGSLDGQVILKHIERCGRVCYKSEGKISDNSAADFVRMLIKRGHESVLEHYSFSVRFICDRGVSHEIVRHRLASYSQESTRYCNYSKKGLTFVIPNDMDHKDFMNEYNDLLSEVERKYNEMLKNQYSPQEARSILPNCLKTEIIMTANIREWRHFLKLRTSRAAHPDIRTLSVALLEELQQTIPVVFDDIVA